MTDRILDGTIVTAAEITRDIPGALRWVVPDDTTTEMPTLEQHFLVEVYGDGDRPIAIRQEWRPVPTIVRGAPQ